MINENCMYECEWCHADLGSNPKAYDEHVVECPAAIAAYKGRDSIEATFVDEYEQDQEKVTPNARGIRRKISGAI